jgi:hypothetical protein
MLPCKLFLFWEKRLFESVPVPPGLVPSGAPEFWVEVSKPWKGVQDS